VCYPPASVMPLHEKKVHRGPARIQRGADSRRDYDDIPKDWVDEILLVDDCSRDRTVEMSREPRHPHRRPQEESRIRRQSEDLLPHLDGRDGRRDHGDVHPDHQYDPKIIPELVAPLLRGECDAVFGSRMLGGRPIEGGCRSGSTSRTSS